MTKLNQREIQTNCNHHNLTTSITAEKIPMYSVKFTNPDSVLRKNPTTTDSKKEENPTCYLASESLQLSRPNSTAKNSTKFISS